jgi:AraC family transcriptional regulator, 4-hydroxyphenylacetate 3-monooxygenase operon regulatory protein
MRTKIAIRPALSGLPPVYQAETRTYQADRCGPVVQAISSGQIRYQSLSRGQYPGRQLQPTDLPGVCLVGFWDAERDQDWGLDWHRNEGIEITCLEAGTLSYSCDSLEHRLLPGDLTIARPWQPHRVGDPRIAASRYHFLIIDVGVRRPHQPWVWPSWVSLTERDRNEITVCMRHTTQVVWPGGAAVRHCFERIGHTVEQDAAGSHVSLLTVYLNELLIRVLEMFRADGIDFDESLGSAQQTVKLFWNDLAGRVDHLAEPWTVKLMARRCGLSVSRFIQLTRRLYNQTPNRHLNLLRVEQASRLLVDQPERTVTDIALSLGFSSSQYFATVFLRERGCSPSALRASDHFCHDPRRPRRGLAQRVPVSISR